MSRDEQRISRLAVRRVLAVGVTVLILDQLTKRLAVASVNQGETKSFLPLIDLVYVRNDGVAFSSFAGRPWIVGLLVVLALIALTIWFTRNRTVPFAWLAAGLLAGGAIGNVLDRIVEGAVIDFIKPRGSFPAFNLADSSIVVGMVVLVVVMELEHRRTTRAAGVETGAQSG